MSITRITASLFALLCLWACANVGNPEGGPYDMTAPRLIKATPSERALHVKGQRIELDFDEFVKISQQDKIIVSPPQIQQPLITANGKHVSIKLLDSLRPNTTYSIYFDDAIVDNNEDNPLEHFSYSFSTGGQIDTMQMSGVVLDAETLEPVGGLVVGAYLAEGLQDSTVLKEAFPFASKTSKQGRFTIRGLRDSVYRVFALKDDDNDYKYNGQSEGFAYLMDQLRTTKRDSLKTDTIRIDSIVRRDTLYRDSLVTYEHTYYYPDNLVLRYFRPESKQRGLQRSSREDSLRFSLEFAEELTSAPELRLLDKPERPASELYLSSVNKNVATYWLKDQALITADSIHFTLKYQYTDSLLRLSEKLDTLTFTKPRPRAEERKKKKDEAPPNPLKITLAGASGLFAGTPKDSLSIKSNLPLVDIDPKLLLFESTSDSVYRPQPFRLEREEKDLLQYNVLFERKYGTKYRLRIDSGKLQSIYGHSSDSVGYEQSISAEAEYGGLSVSITGLKAGKYVAQLLGKSGELLTSQALQAPEAQPEGTEPKAAEAPGPQREEGGASYQATFTDLKPDTYYLRLFADDNGDGRWTTGDYPARQPEMMYYSPMKYEVKKSFTTSESWAPLSRSLDAQKPQELLKTKPEERKKREDKNKEYYEKQEAKRRKG